MIKKISTGLLIVAASALTLGFGTASASKLVVNITAGIPSVMAKHTQKDGSVKNIKIMRNQDTKNKISKHYAATSRKCPPFCVQPMDSFAPHKVEVLGEVGVIHYIKKMQHSSNYLLVDSRTSDWVFAKSGTIPGAVNIPWTKINKAKGATPEQINAILTKEFNVKTSEFGPWDFSNAKTLVLFCNGMWCGQSPSNIRSLLGLGYPASKIKWYRGGMQVWETLGLTTVKNARIVK